MPAGRAAGVGAALPDLVGVALRASLIRNRLPVARGALARALSGETRQGLETNGAVQTTDSLLLVLGIPQPCWIGSLAPSHLRAPSARLSMLHLSDGKNPSHRPCSPRLYAEVLEPGLCRPTGRRPKGATSSPRSSWRLCPSSRARTGLPRSPSRLRLGSLASGGIWALLSLKKSATFVARSRSLLWRCGRSRPLWAAFAFCERAGDEAARHKA